MQERITHEFDDMLAHLQRTRETIAPALEAAAYLLVGALIQERRVFACGNSGSGANLQLFVAKMLNRYEHERPPLPAIFLSGDSIALTAIANDVNFNDCFARPVRALGQPGDILLCASAGGNAGNILQAIQAAHDRDMRVIALTGRDGGDAARLLSDTDVEIRLPAERVTRIHELQLLACHCLLDLVDHSLFGVSHDH